jgi:hypothetical protein
MSRHAYLLNRVVEALFQLNASSMRMSQSAQYQVKALSGAFATMPRADGVLFLFGAPAIDDINAEAPFRPDAKAG